MADLFALRLIIEYGAAWSFLSGLKKPPLDSSKTIPVKIVALDASYAIGNIAGFKSKLAENGGVSSGFGERKNSNFVSLLEAMELKGDDGQFIYPTVSSRAANLFYHIIKEQPFIDGNKRIAAFLFLLYLSMNEHLLLHRVRQAFPVSSVIALSMLVSQSNASQKQNVIQSIEDLIELNPIARGE